MAQQSIGLGTAANDGTGDTLRSAGQKINDNFDELWAINAPDNEVISVNGAATMSKGYHICNKGSALAVSLADGTTVGERHYFTNRGTGIATITPTTLAQGSSVALDQYDGVELIWDGTGWYIIGQNGATIS